jgi:hypothetical protein
MHYALHCAVAAAGLVGAVIGFNLPDPGADRRYDLVQIDDGESDIIDYDQSATDCALKIAAMRRAGYVVECQVSP